MAVPVLQVLSSQQLRPAPHPSAHHCWTLHTAVQLRGSGGGCVSDNSSSGDPATKANAALNIQLQDWEPYNCEGSAQESFPIRS